LPAALGHGRRARGRLGAAVLRGQLRGVVPGQRARGAAGGAARQAPGRGDAPLSQERPARGGAPAVLRLPARSSPEWMYRRMMAMPSAGVSETLSLVSWKT